MHVWLVEEPLLADGVFLPVLNMNPNQADLEID